MSMDNPFDQTNLHQNFNSREDSLKSASPDNKTHRGVVSWLKQGKKRTIALGVSCLCIVVVVVLIAVSLASGGKVSSDLVRKDFEQSSLMQNGVLDQDAYVKPSTYKIKDFKISNEECGEDNGTEYCEITAVATVENESFSVDVKKIRMAYAKNPSGEWRNIGRYNDYDDIVAKPLKGVDETVTHNNAGVYLVGKEPPEAETNDFSSTFEEKDGKYTSTATWNSSLAYWFGSETAKHTRTFVFNSSKGWEEQDNNQDVQEAQVLWNLSGRTFEAVDKDSGGDVTSTITFGEVKGDEITAKYTIVRPNGKSSGSWVEHKAINASGTATGKLVHEMGSDTFSVELNNAINKVTFDCQEGDLVTVAGSGEVPSIRVSITTELIERVENYIGLVEQKYKATVKMVEKIS